MSRPATPGAVSGPASAPVNFDPLPPGLPNRLSDGSVIIATINDREYQSWLIRTALGEFAKLVVYRSRARVKATLACFEADPSGRVNPAALDLVRTLDRIPRPHQRARSPVAAPQAALAAVDGVRKEA